MLCYLGHSLGLRHFYSSSYCDVYNNVAGLIESGSFTTTVFVAGYVSVVLCLFLCVVSSCSTCHSLIITVCLYTYEHCTVLFLVLVSIVSHTFVYLYLVLYPVFYGVSYCTGSYLLWFNIRDCMQMLQHLRYCKK